jgi:16S rRNA C967 or C1407 C5-methylase (RsmB/RsmF family)
VLLKPGGSLIYSTCSISPEENEEVVQWLMDRMHNVEVAELGLPASLRGTSTAWRGSTPSDVPGPPSEALSGTGAAFGIREASSSTARLLDVLLKGGGGGSEGGSGGAVAGSEGGPRILPAPPAWSVLPGLRQYKGRRYSRSMERAVRLLPCLHHEGFFICRLKKQ